MWTHFKDMWTEGRQKTPFKEILINERPKQAIRLFRQVFGIDPTQVTCECCGEDYSIDSYRSLGFLKYIGYPNLKWFILKGNAVVKPCSNSEVLVITKDEEIKITLYS